MAVNTTTETHSQCVSTVEKFIHVVFAMTLKKITRWTELKLWRCSVCSVNKEDRLGWCVSTVTKRCRQCVVKYVKHYVLFHKALDLLFIVTSVDVVQLLQRH